MRLVRFRYSKYYSLILICSFILISIGISPLFSQEDALHAETTGGNQGWYFDPFFLGIEFQYGLSKLHISRVEHDLYGNLWAIGGGEKISGEFIGLLLRKNSAGNWSVEDEFDLASEDGLGLQSLPLFVSLFGDVYYSDGYNLIRRQRIQGQTTIYTPENSGMPEPENDGHEWMVDIIRIGNERWVLYSYPRLVRVTLGAFQDDWDVYDHTNSLMPEPTDSNGVGTFMPARHLAVTGEDLWITTHHENGGLIRKTGDDWERHTTENSDLPSNLVSSIVAQSDQRLWVSTLPTEFDPPNGGLVKIDDGEWTVSTQDNGLPNNFVRVHAAEGDEFIWAAFGEEGDTDDQTHFGYLADFDGEHWSVVAHKNEFYHSLSWVTVDSDYTAWLAGDFLVINGGIASLNRHFLQFTDSPDTDPVYSTEKLFNVDWDVGDRISSVSLSYSVVGSDTWTNIEENIDPGETPYQVPLSDFHANEVMIRLSSDTHEGLYDEVGAYLFLDPEKPYYHLRNLLWDDTYELYDPLVHGWQMRNRENVMWAEEKWSSVEYEGPLARWPFRGESWHFPSFNSLIRAFGEDRTIYKYTPYFHNIWPTIRASILWLVLKGQGWNGVCHGFSVTNLIAFSDGNSSLNQLGASINTENLYEAEVNNDIRKMINMIWARQWSRDHFIRTFLNTLNEDYLTTLKNLITVRGRIELSDILETDFIFRPPSATLDDVKEMLNMRADEGYHQALLLFPEGNIMAGHSVLAYKVEQSEDDPNIWKIYIHDSNYPDADDTYVTVDLDADYYWYDEPIYDEPRFFGNIGLFLADPVDAYKTKSRVLKEVPQENDDIREQIDDLDEFGYMFTLFGPDSDVRIFDILGNSSSVEAGVTSVEIPGSFPIVPLTGGLHDPVGYFLADLDYDVELEYPNGGEGSFMAFTGNTVYGYKNYEPTEGSVDQLRYGNSFSVYGNGSNHQFDMEVSYLNDTDEQMFRLRDISIASGDSINFYLANANELEINNYGEPTALNLELRTHFGDEDYFLYEDFDLDGSTGYKISVPDWDDIADQVVTVYIDTNMDGEYDDSKTLTSIPTTKGHLIEDGIPGDFALYQNYPNPFNPATTIRYGIPRAGNVELVVYDLLGREIEVLVDGYKEAGYHTVTFNAGQLSSGIYLYRISSGEFVETKRLILLK